MCAVFSYWFSIWKICILFKLRIHCSTVHTVLDLLLLTKCLDAVMLGHIKLLYLPYLFMYYCAKNFFHIEYHRPCALLVYLQTWLVVLFIDWLIVIFTELGINNTCHIGGKQSITKSHPQKQNDCFLCNKLLDPSWGGLDMAH